MRFLTWSQTVLLAYAAGVLIYGGCAYAEDGDSYSNVEAINEVSAAKRAEILKSAVVFKATQEGLASYRAQLQLQGQAVTLSEDLTQPDHICQDMGQQDAITSGEQASHANLTAGQTAALSRLRKANSQIGSMEAAHALSNSAFCSESEQAQKICKATSIAKYKNLAGADQDALFLFQNSAGGSTYDGDRNGAQVDAVNSLISRVVVGPTPAPQLPASGAATYQNNPGSRAFVEAQRRYEAFLSMATFSLNQIKESHNPQPQ